MVSGQLAKVDGVECYRIEGVGDMDPFLMTVTSSTDLWMFASSRGSLTAGRTSADLALLPYETDDRIHRSVGITGPVTILARSVEGRRELWQPFGPHPDGRGRQTLAKSTQGDRVVFEETRDGWGLTFRATWMPAPNHGWVRKVEIVDVGGSGAEIEILDGLLDVMPAGVDSLLEQIRSNLVDAYKRSETGRWGTAAIYTLETLITDKAEPAESLAATVVASVDAPWADVHLDERVTRAMIEGKDFEARPLLTGRRGAYLLRGSIRLAPGGATDWLIVADAGLDHARVRDRVDVLGSGQARRLIEADVEAGSTRLGRMLAGADGNQTTGDPIADAHHLSNVLFNVMRGGAFPEGKTIGVSELLDHLARWNVQVHDRHRRAIEGLGPSIAVDELRRFALDSGDSHLIRLVLEYLPLTFSRRHGDPSRPWNRFSIEPAGSDGSGGLGYEGNWRDIFQNWEALLLSYPSYLPNVVAKFVNASTVDGHNPYRISQDGIDWEVPDPHDPWSNIGYWGDHQIVYLHRVLAAWERAEPGALGEWLDRDDFVYADVPYLIAPYREMIDDPRNTIEYDEKRAAAVAERVDAIGADGRLVVASDQSIVRVGLLEKLLVPVLAKLTSFVPGGGLWLNTQRPEWNDANNALAGYGLSMVTLYYLYGYLTWLRALIERHGKGSHLISAPVAGWLSDVVVALENAAPQADADEVLRRALMDELGAVGTRYRSSVTAEFDPRPVTVGSDLIGRLFVTALDHLSRTIAGAKRADGLYDAYNVVSFPAPDRARVRKLGPMLEGQVAILSSGALAAREAADLVDALYESPMYRADQDSFMLYPAPAVPGFLDGNTIPAERAAGLEVLSRLGPDVVVVDRAGDVHFAPAITNGEALDRALERLDLDPGERSQVHTIYEELFDHHSYTGRSGSMYGYEGIGSIYWHMVGKLLLAVQETFWAARDHGTDPDAATRLVHAYQRIRAGLGFCKGPVEYGAVPIDCYSHTPAHAGAQQPGMTGQVKEEILTRFGELGLRINAGRIELAPGLLASPAVLTDEGRADFTFCGVAFRLSGGAESRHRIRIDGNWSELHSGLVLDADASRAILSRRGSVEAVEFFVAGWALG